jgi:ADP-heptose:LPS heptosyltransferase
MLKKKDLRGNGLLRRIDASIGRLLVCVFALFRSKRRFPSEIESIGLLKLSGIGDLVLLSGTIQDLHYKYPRAKLILFCGTDNLAISELIPHLDRVICIPLLSPWKALMVLKKHQTTVMIDLGQWSRIDPLLALGSGCSYVIGFHTKGQHRHYLYDAVKVHDPSVHEIENFRALASLLKVTTAYAPKLQLKPLERSLPVVQEKYVLFHPWPSGLKSHLKEWPSNSWIQLGKIIGSLGYKAIISGSQKDFLRSQRLVDQINRDREDICALNFAGKCSLNELAHFIQRAARVVSVNTGIMHIAACFPVPLVALHGPTSPKRWGPLSSSAVSLIPSSSVCGYLNLGFEYPKNPPRCMEQISVEQVVEALNFSTYRSK